MIATHTRYLQINNAFDDFIAPCSKINQIARTHNEIDLFTPKNSQCPNEFNKAAVNIRDNANLHCCASYNRRRTYSVSIICVA